MRQLGAALLAGAGALLLATGAGGQAETHRIDVLLRDAAGNPVPGAAAGVCVGFTELKTAGALTGGNCSPGVAPEIANAATQTWTMDPVVGGTPEELLISVSAPGACGAAAGYSVLFSPGGTTVIDTCHPPADVVGGPRTTPPPAPQPPAAPPPASPPPASPPPPPPPPPVAACVVPNVKGKTLASARARIAAAGCRTGKVTQRFSTAVRKGRVLAQAPVAGRRATRGARVNLVVSRGRRH